MLLVGRQPAHPMLAEQAVHRGWRDRDLVKALQIVSDLARPEMIVLPQVQNLADHLPRGGVRRPVRRTWPIVQARRAELVKAPFPLVERPPGNPEVSTRPCHTAGRLGRPLQYLEPPG